MSRISSTGITTSAGLISGLPIEETVDQLISLSARPRTLLSNRTAGLRSERAAIDQLSARVLALRSSASRFNSLSTFTGRKAASSSTAVTARIAAGASPSAGSYEFTPLRTASAHQLVSGSFQSLDDTLGGGTLRLGFGGQVDKGIDLAQLNGGNGVAPGQIKINDKNGDSAVIDLRAAQTIDDVLSAINTSVDIDVTASIDGDQIVLTDNTGGTGTLTVRDVGLGSTAQGLGLAGLTAAGATTSITGADVYSLTVNTRLETLNDGLGVDTGSDVEGVDDLNISLRDGVTNLGVDLKGAETLGDVINAINSADGNDGKLTASIRADGRGITLTDNTGSTAANLTVTSDFGSAESLRIDTGSAGVADNSVSGRLVSGLRDTLLANLNGGAGFELGQIDVTDRSGATATIDLSGAETLQEIVETINNAGIGVAAQINNARSGISLTDTSQGSGNLVVADSGATTTATDLGIAVDAAVASVNSGTLSRQTVGRSTRLDSLRGGAGIDVGDFRITNSAGISGAVDLNKIGDEAETVGDVIDAINALNLNVRAEINSSGDGILLTDTAGGSGSFTVVEVGNGTTAADLNLLGASTTTNGSGQATINGSYGYEIDLDALAATTDGVSLASLNGGEGIDLGVFEITDSAGNTAFVNLGEAGAEAFTIDDVISKINAQNGVAVTASLNDAGTGIVLTDNAGGQGSLSVVDRGSGTAAADLKIARTSTTNNASGQQTINSGFLFSADAATDGTLEALVKRINELDAGVTASVLNDLNGSRLVLTADKPGAAFELLLDTGDSELTFTETNRPADAAALFGPSGSGGVVVRSQTNDFNSVIDGINLTVNEASGTAARIDVTVDNTPLVNAAQSFVDAYNSLRTSLDDFTSFDEETLTTGILFGRNEALRVDADLSRILSSRAIFGTDYGSLEAVGISLNAEGRLTLDRTQLTEAFADDPEGVERLFQDDQRGVAKRLTQTIDQLAGAGSSLLSSRSDALQRTIEANDSRIELMTASLDRERDRLLLDFIRLEETIALLQSNTTALENIQFIQIQNR
ncbi:flagellar filament capping protein FliD [Botrimarina hoheduenensis]|uniref:Filament cap protein n=1 Tax=Botrimarina hoheduenensis TaxID=2528000 RepID=A0A5C5VX51_9BACT|nr:flagellar filament capping protein FliD [Botrimarina hoheduenensis]TWT42697.1 Flagellar hook-associated protein 2 [Botrimarina hoheduenensis]